MGLSQYYECDIDIDIIIRTIQTKILFYEYFLHAKTQFCRPQSRRNVRKMHDVICEIALVQSHHNYNHQFLYLIVGEH